VFDFSESENDIYFGTEEVGISKQKESQETAAECT
jgi:hypothetical protein